MDPEKLPRGVVRIADGRYRVRLNRDGVSHSGKTHILLSDAVDALNRLSAQLPPVKSGRKRRKPTRGKVPPGTPMTNIYPTRSGWRVVLMRGTSEHYIGHYQVLTLAIAARDEALLAHPITRKH